MNQEHLDILKQGVGAWNRWKKQHRDVRIDLSGVALDGAQLEKVNLSNANLCEASFISTKLYQANFSYESVQSYPPAKQNRREKRLSQVGKIW